MNLFTASVDDDEDGPLTITFSRDGNGIDVTVIEGEIDTGLVLDRGEVRDLRDALSRWLGEN